jgi:hypothetical protein
MRCMGRESDRVPSRSHMVHQCAGCGSLLIGSNNLDPTCSAHGLGAEVAWPGAPLGTMWNNHALGAEGEFEGQGGDVCVSGGYLVWS